VQIYVDTATLRDNILRIKEDIGGGRLIFEVKADGYGHGTAACARAVRDLADGFQTACVGEAEVLTKAGIEKDILISAFLPKECAAIVRNGYVATVYGIEQLAILEYFCRTENKTAKVQIKIDTGMNRLGVKDINSFLTLHSYISNSKRLKLDGIYSHIHTPELKSMNKQAEEFERYFKETDGKNAHLYSSFPLYKALGAGREIYGGARIGLAAYCPRAVGLAGKPVMAVKAAAILKKNIKSGETIGYDAIFKAEKNIEIAVIMGGYNDGIRRAMAGGNVIVNGTPCKILAVCMDMTIIDVTDVKGALREAVIMGEANDAAYWATHCNTIPYEILTGFSGKRNKRFYSDNV